MFTRQTLLKHKYTDNVTDSVFFILWNIPFLLVFTLDSKGNFPPVPYFQLHWAILTFQEFFTSNQSLSTRLGEIRSNLMVISQRQAPTWRQTACPLIHFLMVWPDKTTLSYAALFTSLKGAQSRYFELFWASRKLLLNWRKPKRILYKDTVWEKHRRDYRNKDG